jgi:polyphosphate kinase
MRAHDPRKFLNRELSWLEFNQRVLDEARDGQVPLLERVKFLCISCSNLDEFFEVRVAAAKEQIESGVGERSLDGATPSEACRAMNKRVRQMVQQQYALWAEDLVPTLASNGIRFCAPSQLPVNALRWAESYYRTQVRPALTPMAIDPAHPFPLVMNKSLNLIVELKLALRGEPLRHLAVVQVPRVLPGLLRLPGSESIQSYVFMEDLIGHFLGDLFPGGKILNYWSFRVTRNSELYVDEDVAENLLRAVETELHKRRKGSTVRLELSGKCPPAIRKALLKTLRLDETDLFLINGPVNLARLMTILDGDHAPELREPPFVAHIAPAFKNKNVFKAIREGDILVHHPYDSFSSVLEFLEQSAKDPDVLAIKITLYRTGGDARLSGALLEALNRGKQVTAVIELRARFDEANNIEWARQLEEAGVQVVYGLVGYKIHAKVCLVVRREGYNIRSYVHLSTGNYNAATAKIYTDLGLFTCRPEFGEDAATLFNVLTGICQFPGLSKILVAPFNLHQRLMELIARETENASKDLPARIIAKVNSLVDSKIIQALYKASQAGVRIDLIVRGICCLRPGFPRLSENITVRSIVDRFLEHSRIFYFENACQPQIYLSSADWMPRNFFHRIELAFPIEDGNLRERLITEMLYRWLADTAKARFLAPDGTYYRTEMRNGQLHRSQAEFMELVQKQERIISANGKSKYPKVRVRRVP